MPRETYLPSGMEGVIVCPVQADPPVLYVNWTKDGNNLNLDNVSCEMLHYLFLFGTRTLTVQIRSRHILFYIFNLFNVVPGLDGEL